MATTQSVHLKLGVEDTSDRLLRLHLVLVPIDEIFQNLASQCIKRLFVYMIRSLLRQIVYVQVKTLRDPVC